jgi:hypothetical protein
MGNSRCARSAQRPETYFSTLAVASAAPSTTPRYDAPAPSEARKIGSSGTTISLATSPQKETMPRRTMLRFTRRGALRRRVGRRA